MRGPSSGHDYAWLARIFLFDCCCNHSLLFSSISLKFFLGSGHVVAQLMKYNFGQAILPESVGTSINFLKDDHEKNSLCPMVRSLFRIDTVEQIFITRDSVTVTKSGIDPWWVLLYCFVSGLKILICLHLKCHILFSSSLMILSTLLCKLLLFKWKRGLRMLFFL